MGSARPKSVKVVKILVLSIVKRQAASRQRLRPRADDLRNTRVLGASMIVWLKNRARSPSCLAKANGLRTRGSRCPQMIPEVLQDIWNANAALSRGFSRIKPPSAESGGCLTIPARVSRARDWLKFHAVKLDIWLILLTNCTVCRESIHFFCSKNRRTIVVFLAQDANL